VGFPQGAQARSRVHLAALPMEDLEENAIIVNALERHATVIAQKSLAEGFGLTVAEAMWRARPVVAARIGGIQSQIVDGESGVLLDDPREEPAAIRSAVGVVYFRCSLIVRVTVLIPGSLILIVTVSRRCRVRWVTLTRR
jgi:Glycosyl transferases group 1